LQDAARFARFRGGVPEEEIAQFHNEVCQVVSKLSQVQARRPPPVESRSLKVLRELAKDESRVVIPADKAKALVVLDSTDSEQVVLRHLRSGGYVELPGDPSPKFNSKFAKAVREAYLELAPPRSAELDVRADARLRADPVTHAAWVEYKEVLKTHGRCGNIYAQVKTHKYPGPPKNEAERQAWVSNLKIRCILPGYRSVDAPMAKRITAALQCLPRPPLSIQSPLQALQILRSRGDVAPKCRLVSLDVVAMFPSIPTDEALRVLQEAFAANPGCSSEASALHPDQLLSLLKLSMDNTFAVVEVAGAEHFFRQDRGLAMGKAYPPVVADHYMGFWEQDLSELAEASGGRVHFALRYADDFLVAFEGSDESLAEWVRCLNSKDPHIDVELEVEQEGRISFLDIAISRGPSGFATSVFRKACFTGQVIPFSSHTQHLYKESGIRSEAMRAARYCTCPVSLSQELQHVRALYKAAGYPRSIVNRVIRKALRDVRQPPAESPEEQGFYLSVPFSGPEFYQLRRAARRVNVRLVSKPAETVGSLLCSKAKHRLPPLQQPNVVYGIKCSCGAVYVGQTERELGTRVSEHERDWSQRKGGSAFGVEPHRHHLPDFENPLILFTEPRYHRRLLAEGSFIQGLKLLRNEVIEANRNDGLQVDNRWAPLLAEALRGLPILEAEEEPSFHTPPPAPRRSLRRGGADTQS
jgi:hypothetical protein